MSSHRRRKNKIYPSDKPWARLVEMPMPPASTPTPMPPTPMPPTPMPELTTPEPPTQDFSSDLNKHFNNISLINLVQMYRYMFESLTRTMRFKLLEETYECYIIIIKHCDSQLKNKVNDIYTNHKNIAIKILESIGRFSLDMKLEEFNLWQTLYECIKDCDDLTIVTGVFDKWIN